MSDSKIRVLVVDDDSALCALLRTFFSTRNVAMVNVAAADDLNRMVVRERPAIIVLDRMLPGIDGLSALRALRNQGDNTPVIMLTAHAEEVDRVIGLEMGADDYIGKPFMPQELMARIRAVLRRRAPIAMPSNDRPVVYKFGNFLLDPTERALTRDGVLLHATVGEIGLLSVMIAHSMQTLSRARLLSLWHGTYVDVTERGLDVPIWRLRRLVEEEPSKPRIIQTIRGIGYMFVPPLCSNV